MAVVKDPVAKARRVKTRAQAARLIAELEPELALNDQLPPGWASQAEEALAIVKSDWPDAEELSYQLDTPVSTSRGAQQGTANSATTKSATARNGTGAPTKAKSPVPSSRGRGSRRTPARRGARRGGRGAGGLWQDTGIPGQAATTTRTVMGLIGGALGLTFLYLLLSNPKAVQVASSGAAFAVRGLVAPVDPLRPLPKSVRTQAPARQTPRPAARAVVSPSPIRTR